MRQQRLNMTKESFTIFTGISYFCVTLKLFCRGIVSINPIHCHTIKTTCPQTTKNQTKTWMWRCPRCWTRTPDALSRLQLEALLSLIYKVSTIMKTSHAGKTVQQPATKKQVSCVLDTICETISLTISRGITIFDSHSPWKPSSVYLSRINI